MDFTTRFYFLFYEAWLGFLYLVRQELEKFADGLATWIQGLTAQTMPENWRDYLAEELADWEDKGIIVQPHSLPVLEKWILAKAKRRGTLPAGYPASDPGTSPDRFADLARQYPSSVVIVDTETAGFDRDSGVVYQETSPEFRAKVQRALELLNPEVAAWWQSPGVNGLVRSYDQDDFPGSSPHHSFCLVENGQAIVVVDRRFTAGRTAQGIIYLAHSGLFSFPKDANFNFRSSLTPMSPSVRALRVGQDRAVLDSARSVSIVAEMAVRQSASLEDGTLAVRAKDIGGMTWRELLQALAAYRLPPDVRALKIILPGRGSGPLRAIFLSADLLRAFLQLPLPDRQAIMAAASSVRPDEAQAAIARAVAAKTPAENLRPVGHELAPSPELPYNSGRNQTAPASPHPIALAADAEKKQPAGKSPTNAADPRGLATYTFGWDPPGNEGGVDDSLWGSQKPKTWRERLALRDYWDRGMDTALLFWAFAPNASLFLQHFLANTGTKHTADVKSLTSKSTFANNYMVKDVNDAMAFAEANVKPGSGARIVTTGESAGRNASDSLDWFYALGYYRTWARGTVSHGLEKPGLPAKFTMTWQYSIRDDYGFSAKPKKFGIGGGVADTEMAALNLAGYARSFEVIGTQTITVEWHRGQRVGSGAKVTR
jgi:hypothetical protein